LDVPADRTPPHDSPRVLAAADLAPGAALDGDLLVHGDNLAVLGALPAGAFDLAYLDPPFNTGREQRRGALAYGDDHADWLDGLLRPRLARVRELLAPHGTVYLHLDFREAHRARGLLDELFGPAAFLNELVWAYDFGGRPRDRWPAKHDTILVYVRTPGAHHFDAAEVEREPYMAPGLVGPEKAARGKLPTDVWWHTIVGTTSREKTGYPTQKPEGVLRRMVAASSRPGGWCLDPFAGSGTLGAACRSLGRRFVLIDESADAIGVAARRLGYDGAGASSQPSRSRPSVS
jgi:site-specific DNA-methyltransferase (adenine-specific)